ncbi:MAG TPA: SufE family protein [Opitutus sp.]|nr:SufE family protein [Opitutus sp.]
MSLNARQQSLLDEIALHDDPQERLAAVVDRARRRPALPASDRTAAHRVPGCSSQVWLLPELRDGRCHFRADADSPLVRSLVLLLSDFFSNSTPAEILATDLDPLEPLGLTRTLSSTRRHGLAAVRRAIRAFAQTQLSPFNSRP